MVNLATERRLRIGVLAMATAQTTRELTFLFAFRQAQTSLGEEMAATALEHLARLPHSNPNAVEETLACVRSDAAFQIAELFFVLNELGVVDAQRFRLHTASHNARIAVLLRLPQRERSPALSDRRLRNALLHESHLAFIDEVSQRRLKLDQSSLGRLLVEVMSPESCRRATVGLANGGLLRRRHAGKQLVWSGGTLEAMFRKHLEDVLDQLACLPQARMIA